MLTHSSLGSLDKPLSVDFANCIPLSANTVLKVLIKVNKGLLVEVVYVQIVYFFTAVLT